MEVEAPNQPNAQNKCLVRLRNLPKQLTTNSWSLREGALKAATFLYVVAVVLILCLTLVAYKDENPLAVCFPGKNETSNVYHGLAKGSIYYYFTVITLSILSIILLSLQGYLLRKGKEVFLWEYLDKSKSPFHQTIYFTISLLLSLVPSAFKYYKLGGLFGSLGLTLWSSLMQVYLQPKCDIGLFSTSVSAGLSILCGTLQCYPKDIKEWVATLGSFIIYVVLYYYYVMITHNPYGDEIYLVYPNSLPHHYSLTRVMGDELETLKTQNPNSLFHLLPRKRRLGDDVNNLIIMCLVPSEAYTDELRRYVEATGNHKWQFVRRFYTFRVLPQA